jgi:hypothetical protein
LRWSYSSSATSVLEGVYNPLITCLRTGSCKWDGVKPASWEGARSVIGVLFSDHRKCLDLIFIYLSGLMISIGNPRLMNHASRVGAIQSSSNDSFLIPEIDICLRNNAHVTRPKHYGDGTRLQLCNSLRQIAMRDQCDFTPLSS